MLWEAFYMQTFWDSEIHQLVRGLIQNASHMKKLCSSGFPQIIYFLYYRFEASF